MPTQASVQSPLVILVVGAIGGVVGGGTRFLFEDLLRPMLARQSMTREIATRHSIALTRAAESLERRLSILVRNQSKRWIESDSDFQRSTMYAFADYLVRVRMIEIAHNTLPYGRSRVGRAFYRHMYGPIKALNSHAYFRWHEDQDAVGDSALPRAAFTAMGEFMINDIEKSAVLSLSEFNARFDEDPDFRKPFEELLAFLGRARPEGNGLRWDRLIAAGVNLRLLVNHLDPYGRQVPSRGPTNMDLIVNSEVRKQLEEATLGLRLRRYVTSSYRRPLRKLKGWVIGIANRRTRKILSA